jgi:uncharacterized protein YjiS (DUF1127 family)
MDTRNRFSLRLWRRVGRSFAAWQDRANARIELTGLTDRTLQDIGLSRGSMPGIARLTQSATLQTHFI